MLHCPRNSRRLHFWRRRYSSQAALATPSRPIRRAIGGSRTASPRSGLHNVAAVCGAWCPGSRNRAAATTTIPMFQRKTRPTLGMPILIDMKKKPGVDQWEGQVYNAKDGKLYSSTITPAGTDQLEIGAVCSASSAAARPGRASARRSQPAPPTAWPRARPRRSAAAESCRPAKDGRPRPAGRRNRRYLPTRRYRAACPLAPAGTAAPLRASSPATAPATCPCSTFRDGSTATGCRTRLPSSSR